MKTLAPEQQRRVLDGAVNLLTKADLDEITLDQLTRTCSVPAMDIVRHCQSKENILTAVLERELDLIAGATHEPELRFPGETLKEELETLATIMLEECRRRLPFLGRVLVAAMRSPHVGALFYRTFIMQGRLLFTEFLKKRRALGELKDDLVDERLVRELSNTFPYGVAKK